jgi:hypothetical protein
LIEGAKAEDELASPRPSSEAAKTVNLRQVKLLRAGDSAQVGAKHFAHAWLLSHPAICNLG